MKKFEKIIIATDLDGTYFGSRTKLVQRNLERVQYFCENGGHFTFNTGRLPIFMRKALPNAAELINMPAITGNGTCLYDFQANKPIEEHFHDFKVLSKVIEYVREYSPEAGMRGCISEGLVIPDIENEYTKREYYYFPDFMKKVVTPTDNWETLNIYKVNVMDTEERLTRLYPVIKEAFADSLQISRAGLTAIEIMPYGTSKAVMLKGAVERLFGEDVTLCTVGDYDNDLEMHAIADLPVCPSNANERVKSVCRHTLCSNDEGVIGDLIDLLDKKQ